MGDTEASPSDFTADDYYPLEDDPHETGHRPHHHHHHQTPRELQLSRTHARGRNDHPQRWAAAAPSSGVTRSTTATLESTEDEASTKKQGENLEYGSPPALARLESSTATFTTLRGGGGDGGGGGSSTGEGGLGQRSLSSSARGLRRASDGRGGSSSLVMLVSAAAAVPHDDEVSAHLQQGAQKDNSSRRSFATTTRVLCDESANTTPLLYPGAHYDDDDDDGDDDDGNTDDDEYGYGGRYPRRSAHAMAAAASPRVLYSTRRRAPLNGLNYLNVVTYLLHLFVSWGIGVWGLGGHVQTRWEIANEHETLVTPSAFTLWIWYPILVLEGVFAVAQLLPYYRARPIVQGGTSYWFFYTFLIQTGWTLFYSFQLFIFSFVAVLAALASLVGLLASQQASLVHDGSSYAGPGLGSATGGTGSTGLFGMRSTPASHRSRAGRLTEYYLFRFPFYLHTGWMAFCAAHHFSLLFRSYDAGVGLQVAIDIVSLGWLLPTALIFLACPHFKDFVIPFVIIWSYVGVACRLLHPSDAMMDMFGPVVVDALRIASIFFAGTVGLSLVPNIFVWLAREFCTISVVELDE